ncbi:MAG: hypothetical protein AAGD05_07145, partial [Bacteroidota bacterium]
MRQYLAFIALLCLLNWACKTQQPLAQSSTTTKTHRVAFYNVENLFDTEDDPGKEDEEFMPTSKKKWTQERYQKKLNDLAKVFAAMEYPSLIGVCEVENEKVLKALTQTTEL